MTSVTDLRAKLPEVAQLYLEGRSIDEVECIVADLAGVARGKAMPGSKFAAQRHFYLPNSIFFQTVTGDWAEVMDDGYTEPDMVLTPDFSTREPRAMDGGLDASGHPRHRASGRNARAFRAAQCPQTRRGPLPGARLDPRRRPRDGVLPRRAQHRPGPRDRAAHGTLGPSRRRKAGLFHERRGRIRPHHRRYLRLRRGAGAGDRRHPARRRRGTDRAQPPPRRPGAAGRRDLLFQADDPGSGAAPRVLRHLHGQTDRGRARQRHACPSLRRRHQDGAEHLFPRPTVPRPRSSCISSAGCSGTFLP